jgi:hypothetical protein
MELNMHPPPATMLNRLFKRFCMIPISIINSRFMQALVSCGSCQTLGEGSAMPPLPSIEPILKNIEPAAVIATARMQVVINPLLPEANPIINLC